MFAFKSYPSPHNVNVPHRNVLVEEWISHYFTDLLAIGLDPHTTRVSQMFHLINPFI